MRLAVEVHRFEDEVRADCPTTNENQLAALTCLAYNIGAGAFHGSTVRRMHNAGDFMAAANAFLMWDKVRNIIVPGLVRRREAERSLYLQ